MVELYSLMFNSAKAAGEVCLFVAVGICGISWVEHVEDFAAFFLLLNPQVPLQFKCYCHINESTVP